MSTIKLSQYVHRPNSTELGLGNTHETYMLIGSDTDLSGIFPPSIEVVVHDTLSQKDYMLKSSDGREFRVNQMGDIYRDYDVHPGDEIIITKTEIEQESNVNVFVKTYNRVVLVIGNKGTEICNIDRLGSPGEDGTYKINIYDRGNASTLSIVFKNALKKRNDSPTETNFYTASLNGSMLANGTYYLDISARSSLLMLPKSNYNEVVFDSNLISQIQPKSISNTSIEGTIYRSFITAIKTKPFLLLAGISGTGKSRIVRELARACWNEDSEEFKAQKTMNFEMVQVKPNWHDSTELLGYVTRISGKSEFVAGDFLKFIVKAWENKEIPYFLCLDEMNLAPVEQYFAEFLSVIESRKSHEDGSVTTDPILKKIDEEWYFNLTASLTMNEDIRKKFNEEGICIPQNLIVVGTVNMDETTFSFSRKVLDRAMTIEMNDVDLKAGLTEKYESIGKLGSKELIGTAVEGVDVYENNKEVCDKVLDYLVAVNTVLDGTPFKIAYRTRNEFLLYVVNNLPYLKNEDGTDISQTYVIARALDEVTNMKILPRIEGDETKVSSELLDGLTETITNGLKAIAKDYASKDSVSLAKLKEMKRKLETSGYTSYWS